MVNNEFASYRRLAAAVIGNAISVANETGKSTIVVQDARIAKSFLFNDEAVFDFWCEVADVDGGRLRNGIKNRLSEIGKIRKERSSRKRETKPRTRLSSVQVEIMLDDMRSGMPAKSMMKKYGIQDSSLYYYAKKFGVGLVTCTGTYNKQDRQCDGTVAER